MVAQRRVELRAQARADFGMGADRRVLVHIEPGGLAQDRVGNADLAEDVQEAADRDARHFRIGRPSAALTRPAETIAAETIAATVRPLRHVLTWFMETSLHHSVVFWHDKSSADADGHEHSSCPAADPYSRDIFFRAFPCVG